MLKKLSPGRPRKDGRAAVTKRDVLNAAARLFLTRGYGGTSIKMIADAIEAHPSSIFHHFHTKQDVLTEIIDLLFGRYELFAQALADAGLQPDVFLYKIIYEDVLACSVTDTPLLRVFLLPELRSAEFPFVAKYWTRIAAVYEREIRRGQEVGQLVACDAELAAEALFVIGMTPIASFTYSAKGSDEAAAASIARLSIRSLLQDPRRLEQVVAAAEELPETLSLRRRAGGVQPATGSEG